MLLDWMLREGAWIFSWWLLVTLAGGAVLPLIRRLLPALPDEGYTLARTMGMLWVGYVFWLLSTLGFLVNNEGSILLAWVLVFALSWVVYHVRDGATWAEWFRANRTVIVVGEILFMGLFVGWALVRANYPALTATEKPMELAFISAIERSQTFPPNDPWMSGYAISYYYFGYIMSAVLVKLSGVTTSVGFNLTISLLFALTGLTAFGVVYNLVEATRRAVNKQIAHWTSFAAALLGVFMVAVMGNLQAPLIELPYQSGWFNDGYYAFWDVQERTTAIERIIPPDEQIAGGIRAPQRWEFWWWFRASRVINDRDLPTATAENSRGESVGANVIDEFPQFSFLLADVHPHVLALPFSLLALGLALHTVLRATMPQPLDWLGISMIVGGLIFLNTWDGAIYLMVMIVVELARRLRQQESFDLRVGGQFAYMILALIVTSLLLYLPFILSFRSQASGFLPNLQWATSFPQLFIMFGGFFLLLFPFLIYTALDRGKALNWQAGRIAVLGVFASLFVFALALVVMAMMIPHLRVQVLRTVELLGGMQQALPYLLLRRATTIVTPLILFSTLGIAVAWLFGNSAQRKQDAGYYYAFAILVCAVGLIIVPEFVYLRDNFGVRINTIFKFYYQAWVMLAVVASFVTWHCLNMGGNVLRSTYGVVLAGVVILGSVYPLLGIHNRTLIESGRGRVDASVVLTLEGGNSLASNNDYQAIQCLNELVKDDDIVVAEAIGPAYRHQFGRVGVLAGIPIVLGWEGHESQWRGATYPRIVGTRRADIEMLYNDLRWEIAQAIIERYSIDYIFYGDTERFGTSEQAAYVPAGEEKFRENLQAICEVETSLFYRVAPEVG
ncbi:MAG: DUF2298 domain-containing protein [Phototrophicaceae bacterium]